MLTIFGGYWQDEQGLTTVEYALLLALIVLVSIAAWTSLDTSVHRAVATVNQDGFGG